jgi:signal transduction histidine kinase
MILAALGLRRSFRAKVAFIALVATLAALLAAFTLLLMLGWSAEREQLVRSRGAVAQVLAYNLSQSLVFEDRMGAKIRLESVRNTLGFRSALVFDRDGRVFAQMGEKTKNVGPSQDRARMTPTWRYTTMELEYRIPVIVDHARVGELVLVSGLDELWRLLRSYLAAAGLSFTVATGVALMTGFWLARIIIEPVSRLARAMVRVRSSGEFGHAVDKTSDDEVGNLTDAFNDLLGELKRSNQSLHESLDDVAEARQASLQKSYFLSNMSHEIRTPLNGVLGMAQAMQMDELPPRQAERLAVIRSSGEMLLAVLNDILDISKIEAGKFELETVEFDLNALVESGDHRIIGEFLVQARQGANVSQDDLAARLTKPQSFVSNYERGQRRIDFLEFTQIVLALGLNPITLGTMLLERIQEVPGLKTTRPTRG